MQKRVRTFKKFITKEKDISVTKSIFLNEAISNSIYLLFSCISSISSSFPFGIVVQSRLIEQQYNRISARMIFQGRAVQTAKSLDEGLNAVNRLASNAPIFDSNDQKLVYISGKFKTSEVGI